MTLSSCVKTLPKIETKIVSVDSFCEGKYKPLYFTPVQWDRIENKKLGEFGDVLEIYIKNHALNSREFIKCAGNE